MTIEEKIEALYRSACSERDCGNHSAAQAFADKAEALKREHGLLTAQEEELQRQNAADDARRKEAQIRILEKVPDHMRCQILVIEPGMKRQVFRMCSKKLALELVLADAAYYIRCDDGSNDVFFHPQEVPKEPEKKVRKIWI